ncbi:glycosyltransferase family 4 protein [Brevibacillus sp. AG]|uniref:glycosyltransferase family 4 protein n=1 Tax=Brevibacillus sp. AG TaxID=3020891 RepID=UPI00232C57C8|nr:glycosyltransferase family 4 protein [Brevibacillus sp. AG]MDC0761651.1 glycosyltransferase family 4 protein [Brevibacillus sp. AG]
MKKVWIVNQYSVTPEYPASTRHYELAKYLAKRHTVTLWGSNFIHHNKTYRFSKWTLIKKEVLEGFRFLWIGAISYKDNGVLRFINMFLFAICFFVAGLFQRERPDVLIGSSPPLFTAFSAMLLAKVKKAVFILEVRDLWPDSLIDIAGGRHKLLISLLRWMEHVLYREADKIIVLTEGIGDRIHQKGISQDKLFFLANGIDIETVTLPSDPSHDRQKIRESLGISNEDFVCMYAGAHGPANDLVQLICAMEMLKEEHRIKIVLMGEGIEKPKLQQITKEKGLGEGILFLSAVSKSNVHKYLNCADAFLICLKDVPLFEGALPNKLFDYLLHEKLIITTVRGELLNFLERFNLGVYGNIKETGEHYLPEVIRKLAYGEFSVSSISGKDIVSKQFSRENQAETLAVMMEELIKNGR